MIVLVGVFCEVGATLLGTLGKQLVSYSGKLRAPQRARLFKLAGLTVTSVFGPILDSLAYALAPQSLVAPLNGLDIVWNACSAPFTLGERLTRSYALGSALVFLGASLSSCFSQHHNSQQTLERERELFTGWRFLLYVAAGATGLLACAAVLRRRPRGAGDFQRGVALGGAAGFVAGNMFFLSEALGIFREALATGQWAAWRHPLPYCVTAGAVTVAVANVPLMAKALEEYDALFMITLFAGCQITTACVSAQVVLREMGDASWPRVLGYWACIGLVVLGLLAVGRQARRAATGAPAALPLRGPEAPAARPKASIEAGAVLWAGSCSGVAYGGPEASEDEEPGPGGGLGAAGAARRALEDGRLTASSAGDSSSSSSSGGSGSDDGTE